LKILLVAPIFRPQKGVSVKRVGHFYDNLSKTHDTDVLTFSDKDNFESNIMTIRRNYFYPFIKANFRSSKIRHLLKPLVKKYDLVIISVPDFGLLEIVDICKSVGVTNIVDLRDQPDLDYLEYNSSNKIEKLLYYFYNQLLQKYVYRKLNKADYISIVGEISTSIVKEKLKKDTIYNVHNGFFEEDREFVASLEDKIERNIFTISWVGNIYRFRDTKELREILLKLDRLAEKEPIVIAHYGTLNDSLNDFVKTRLKHIKYNQRVDYDRKSFLRKLSNSDMFLLSCSDSLVWEPTTSVFDYILFNKPVIFSGCKNNEAYNILNNSNMNIFYKSDLNEIIFKIKYRHSIEDISMYSREKSFNDLNNIITIIEKTKNMIHVKA